MQSAAKSTGVPKVGDAATTAAGIDQSGPPFGGPKWAREDLAAFSAISRIVGKTRRCSGVADLAVSSER